MNIFSYKIILSYDGTAYQGWQKNRQLPTIEIALEKAVHSLGFTFCKIEGASRTDAGVHAQGQVVRIDLEKKIQKTSTLLVGLNSKLPKDIQVIHLEAISNSFHPTLDAKEKTYSYQICMGSSQHPCYRYFSWHVPYTLEIETMKLAAELLQGTHNFQAFTNRKKNETYEDFERTVRHIEILEIEPSRLKIVVQGNSFMYKMIRNLVGLLVQVGRSKITLNEVSLILKSCDRRLAPLTAPAHGLCLTRIDY